MQPGKLYGVNPRGAGYYGGDGPTHKTSCPNSNNPHGHSRDCACGWWAREQAERASQSVPYYPETRWPDV